MPTQKINFTTGPGSRQAIYCPYNIIYMPAPSQAPPAFNSGTLIDKLMNGRGEGVSFIGLRGRGRGDAGNWWVIDGGRPSERRVTAG